MATFAQLKTRAQAQAFSENATDAAAFVNDVYRDVVRRCGLNVTESIESLTAGTWKYGISANFGISDLLSIDVVSGTTSGTSYSWVLEPTSAETIIAQNVTSTLGQPRQYALQGIEAFLVYPAPDTGVSLTIRYFAAPTALSADGDTPTAIPSEYHYLLQYGAAALLANEEGSDLAITLSQLYENELVKVKGIINQMDANLSKRVRVGYPWKLRPLSGRNDTYPAA